MQLWLLVIASQAICLARMLLLLAIANAHASEVDFQTPLPIHLKKSLNLFFPPCRCCSCPCATTPATGDQGFWAGETPAVAVYIAVRGVGLLGSSFGAHVEKAECQNIVKELLDTEAPLPRRRRYLLAGLRVDKPARHGASGHSGAPLFSPLSYLLVCMNSQVFLK